MGAPCGASRVGRPDPRLRPAAHPVDSRDPALRQPRSVREWYHGRGPDVGDHVVEGFLGLPAGAFYLGILCILAGLGGVLGLGLISDWGLIFPRWIPVLGGHRVPPWLPLTPTFVGSALMIGLLGDTALAIRGRIRQPQLGRHLHHHRCAHRAATAAGLGPRVAHRRLVLLLPHPPATLMTLPRSPQLLWTLTRPPT